MLNILPQNPVISGNTLTLSFNVGPTAIDSFDLEVTLDPDVFVAGSATLGSPATGWTVTPNFAVSPALIGGFNLSALPSGSTLFTLSATLKPGVSGSVFLTLSGIYNDPSIAIPLTQFGFVTGTTGDDFLTGSAGNDSIQGLAGDDSIDAAGGDDTVSGGTGLDNYTTDVGKLRVTDATYGETFQINGAVFTGETVFIADGAYDSGVSVSTGAGPTLGQVHWSSAGGVTTLQIGLDSIAGADATVTLDGNFAQADFQAFGSTIQLNRLPGGSLTISGTPTEARPSPWWTH